MNNPLADAYLVLCKVYGGGAYLKRALEETDIEPANAAKTTKICYGVLEKDIFLDRVIDCNVERSPRKAVRLVLKIALYMLEFLGKHDYMVVDNAVELVKKLGKGGTSGFVNAFLRSYEIPTAPKDPDEALSVAASAPLWLAKRMRRVYGDRAYDILCTPSRGVCVRFEISDRGDVSRDMVRDTVDKYLERPHSETPFENVYVFPNFSRDDKFREGLYTFQSMGSVAICDVVASCDKLLDACAAPGGKSVLLSKKCGSVVAQDVYPHRVELIGSYSARMHAENVTPILADAEVFNPEWESSFDAVLCDVPCSGSGVINENPDIKLFRKEEDMDAIVATQRKILRNCARYVKSGGALYYSTCSCLPEENDEVVCRFLDADPGFEVVKIFSPLANETTEYGLQFLPDISLGVGFYVAKMVKKS